MKYEIVRLAKGGEGIGYCNGKAFFIEGALPGESGDAEIIEEKQHYGRARAVTRMSDAPERCPDNCEMTLACAGCGFRHVRSEAALRMKSEAVYGEMVKMAKIPLPDPELAEAGGPLDGCRTRVRLHLSDDGIGYFGRDSHRIVSAASCPVIAPPLRKSVSWLETHIPRDICRKIGGRADIQVDLDDTDRAFAHFKPVAERILRRHRHRPGMKVPSGGPCRFEYLYPIVREGIGEGIFAGIRVADEDFGEKMIRSRVSSPDLVPLVTWRRNGDFAQASAGGNAILHAVTAEFLEARRPGSVADLFSGSGNLTFRAASVVGCVDAYEQFCDSGAFERGLADNAGSLISPDEVKLHICDLARGLPDSARRVPAIICDPARDGLSERLCADLCASNVRDILYISCEPACLARDLARIGAHFCVSRLIFADMFPMTPHVEAAALLERIN